MAEFDELRERLRLARAARELAGGAVAAVRERLRRIRHQESELARGFNPENREHVRARERLGAERAQAEKELGERTAAKNAAVGSERGALLEFSRVADPRTSIAAFDDSIPILLMPVRLETRFKTLAVPGAPARHQLWVRVYPDDCWIDSFEPVLSTTEVENANTYWTSLWQAGGIEEQERAAWKALAQALGSGRASFVVEQYRPANQAEKPTKALPDDVILTIATPTPPGAAEAVAAMAFFRAAWLADGDGPQLATARAVLEAAVGATRAAEIVVAYVPANFGTRPRAGLEKAAVNVSVAFVVFPSVETKQNAWSTAPRAVILPERFLFIGYDTPDSPNPLLKLSDHPVPTPLPVGPDPSAPKDQQLKHDEDGNLILPEELRWIADFESAEAVGMALRIDLDATQAARGFARVLVIGLRSSSDAQSAKTELETLFSHHAFSRTGLALVPQGTPTNNTEARSSGHARLDDPDQTFDDRQNPLFTSESGWLDKKDGQWLAECLGLDPSRFLNVHGADATDQAAARAMNAALFPATLGYWMHTMMAPVFTDGVVERTRGFFTRHVVGSGTCPAIRIGFQPYGILPTSAFSRMRWFEQRSGNDRLALAAVPPEDPMRAYLARLYTIVSSVDADLRARVSELAYVGKAGDPHALLLEILGLHSGSVEWAQRYAESLKTLYNRLVLQGLDGVVEALFTAAARQQSAAKLDALGYTGEKEPPLLDLIFSGRHQGLAGGVVDDRPLSESEPIRAYTASGKNYIEWLIEAAGVSLDALYRQADFVDDKAPSALLYLTLRHALQLGYHDSALRLRATAGLYTPQKVAQARADQPFLHVQQGNQPSESRYEPLYAVAPEITGSATEPLHRFIGARLALGGGAAGLSDQLRGLERLKHEPTARLERTFSDHVDCCAYRLDAWLLGLVNYQLAGMRNLHDEVDVPARTGLYLGAYAWLEELRPENKVLTPVTLRDPELAATFQGAGEPPLVRDSSNQGYVHAPSLNHAVAAAVLRNGYVSAATPENHETLAVNLTSERVRTGLALLEGIRAGQSIADLLGYQLERGLHDRHATVEVDRFIYKLRKAFPLRADRFHSTKTPEGVPIEAIEARNVVNGLALAEHVKKSANKSYPWGKAGSLPAANATETAALDAEVERLLDSLDAVADLALSEGVYQAVLGNYDRVASTYDAYGRGNFPPEPDVIRTPTAGVGLTQRVALHLEAGASHTVSPLLGVSMTPRATAEPALNRWLAKILPAPADVGCIATFREAASGLDRAREVTLAQLELQPADWLALIRDDDKQAMSELDDRIVRFVNESFGARPDIPVTVRYLDKDSAAFSVFQLMPLLRNLRRVLLRGRALKVTDLTLMNEARSQHDTAPSVNKARLDAVRSSMQLLRDDIAAERAVLDGPLADLENRRAELLTNADAYVGALSALLARAATFVLPQAGWGFAFDFRSRTYAAIVAQCSELVARWDDRLAEFDTRIVAVAAEPDEARKLELLASAERLISTTSALPPPPPSPAYLTVLGLKRAAFAAKRDQFAAIAASTTTAASALLANVRALSPVAAFDFVEVDLTPHEDAMLRFAEDATKLLRVVEAELDRRLSASQALFDQHDAATDASGRVKALELSAKALLGEDFRIIPEFALGPTQASELANAFAHSESGELLKYLVEPAEPERDPLDFPLDTWLYGVARVREGMHAWEQVVMFAGALKRPEPELTPLQLPFVPGDRWLGLEFPPEQKLDLDRLLYTAHFAAPFDAASSQCGLLLDEWTETIPGARVDTGIAFHHDRPNCEAPQTMLLVTPPEFRGAWRFDDLVAALNETLDLAKRRAFEPKHLDASPLAPFLPASVTATQARQLTIALDFALNNRIALAPKD